MNTGNKRIFLMIFFFVFAFYVFLELPYVVSWGPFNNYRNFSVRATVNVTDALPEIMNITCNDGSAVSLSPGTVQNVSCLIQIRDYNGGDTLNGTNGSGVNQTTFYYVLNQSGDPDDNNVHYTNSSCSVNGTAYGPLSEYINWTCGFYIWYYANNGTWFANATVHDRYNNQNYNVSATGNATIQPLYALNVTDVIDFGNLAIGDTSSGSVEANVTNFGNMNINLSVYGYGAEDPALTSLAMVCSVRNITIANERYSVDGALSWAAMTPLSGTSTLVQNLTVVQQQNDAQPVVNFTYWRLYVDPTNNPFGECNGTVIYSAIAT